MASKLGIWNQSPLSNDDGMTILFSHTFWIFEVIFYRLLSGAITIIFWLEIVCWIIYVRASLWHERMRSCHRVLPHWSIVCHHLNVGTIICIYYITLHYSFDSWFDVRRMISHHSHAIIKNSDPSRVPECTQWCENTALSLFEELANTDWLEIWNFQNITQTVSYLGRERGKTETVMPSGNKKSVMTI